MFSRSLGVANVRPKILYLLSTIAGQWHTIGKLSSVARQPEFESKDWYPQMKSRMISIILYEN